MIYQTSFVVRESGSKFGSYYIDYLGRYKVQDIARIVGIDKDSIIEKYIENEAEHYKELDVYYFETLEKAKNALNMILELIKQKSTGRLIFFTETEIEYIRKALINDGGNRLHVNNSVKDEIFKKLNS